MRIIALDPATLCGYAVVDVGETEAHIVSMGVVRACTSSEFQGDWLIDLRSKIASLLDVHSPSTCYVEDYFFHATQRCGSALNMFYRAAIYMLMRDRGITYRVVSPSQWKKFVVDRRVGAKPPAAGKDAQKIMVKTAIESAFGVRFPATTCVDGRNLKFKYDVSDAVGIAIFGLNEVAPHIKLAKNDSPETVRESSSVRSVFDDLKG